MIIVFTLQISQHLKLCIKILGLLGQINPIVLQMYDFDVKELLQHHQLLFVSEKARDCVV